MKRSCIGMILYLLLVFVGLPAYLYATAHPAHRVEVALFLLALFIGIFLVIKAELKQK